MNPKTIFAKAIEQATSCVRRVNQRELGDSTPCTEWDLRTLLNHMVYEMLWVPDILAGKTIAEVGDRYNGDVIYSEPASAWQRAADAALGAVKQAEPRRVVHLSYADKMANEYIAESAGDMLIHAWDVGQALHCTLLFDKTVARAVYDNILPRKAEFAASGLFARPIDVPKDSSIEVKLLGLVGRRASMPI